MSEPARTNPDEVKRQVGLHLDSLRAAGIEYLPARPSEPLPAQLPLPAEKTPAAESPPVASSTAIQPVLVFASTGAAGSLETRAQELQVLAGCVAECRRCMHLVSTRTQTVFGVGPLDPELCFIGEAPGEQEDRRGEPFVGPAGQLLDRIIAACGMRREEVYICNILRCRPPNNRTPNAEEAANCREYLEKQLELVRPRYICCLGACAAQNLLGTTQSIGKMRGRVMAYNGIPVFATYHPSYLLRYPEEKKKVWEDMKKMMTHMGRTLPQVPRG